MSLVRDKRGDSWVLGAGLIVWLAAVSCTTVVHEHDDDDDDNPRVPTDEDDVGRGGRGGISGDDDDSPGYGGSISTGGFGGAFPSGGSAFGGTFPMGGSAGAFPTGGAASGGSSSGGTAGEGGQAPCSGQFTGYLRDFQPDVHPDFEPHNRKPTATSFYNAIETGIVRPELDPVSRKPVYGGGPTGTNTTIGDAYFPSWFLDTPGANLGMEFGIELTDPDGDGLFVFDGTPTWFPIDDGANCPVMPQTPCLLGNSTNYPTHNYAFTFELHTTFVYRAGASFRIQSDDDAWIFVDGELVVDLGGIHMATEGRVDFGGLSFDDGTEHRLELFKAERHVTDSRIHIETDLEFIDCGFEVPR